MIHRDVWAYTTILEHGTGVAVVSMQGRYSLTMREIGAHRIAQ
jgi:hypothetical protein